MKKLYGFNISKEIEVDETQITKDEKGQEVKTITKVKKSVPQKFFILKPNRTLIDEADLFYGVKLFEGIQAGLLTRQLLAKRYLNDGGSMSEPEKETYATLYLRLYEKQNEYQKLAVADVKEPEKEKELVLAINKLRQDIQELEFNQISLFDQTAESRARNKTIMWWSMFLAHEETEDGKVTPFFGEGDIVARLEKHDDMIESDDAFQLEVLNKFLYLVSFWYMGRANKKEDFEALDKASRAPVEEKPVEPVKEVK